MKKRQRKKWLKQHNLYVNPIECWNLDLTIAKYVLPRLKLFRKDVDGYSANTVSSYEEWLEILDKMILAFEYIVEGDAWKFDDPRYDYFSGLHEKFIGMDGQNRCFTIEEDDWVAGVEAECEKEANRRQVVINEGLTLFAKHYQALWN